ncbi:MAG: MMPL family transporter [Candidatus Phosphoribacter sp.]|nr:MMPL family transporter [Actinomycetales bacterium]
MSSVLYALGHWAVRRRRLVLVGWVVLLVAFAVAAGLLQRGTSDTFDIPGTQSQKAMDALTARFPEFSGASGQVVVSAPPGTTVADPVVQGRIEELASRYAALPHVRNATSPLSENVRGTVSVDGSTAIINVQFDIDATEITDAIREPIVRTALESTRAGLTASVGGALFMPTTPEMSITEGLGVLVALIVLLATFGSALAAGIPLLTSVMGVIASMAVIFIGTRFTTVTSTGPFLALMIGLAVGIDYALFVVSRHRDLLADGVAPEEAAARATGTAGSAVVFAGATVAIALLALGVAGIPFLTVMGICAALGVAWAVAVALTALPAILGAAGSRLTPRRVAGAYHARRHTGWAARWVRLVTAVPLLTTILVVAGLGALTLPARDLALSLPNNGTAAPGSTQRQAFDTVAQAFGAGANAPLVITLDIVATTDPLGVVAEVERMVLATPGIVSVSVATPNRSADTGVIVAIPAGSADSRETIEALRAVRELAPAVADRFDVDLAVTGHTAAQVDVSSRLAGALLPFGIVVVGLSLVLLALVFRSILVPLTAAAGYLLSLGAAFGVVVAVTSWGWLAGPLGVDETGPVIAFMPIILMGVLFGLAMDYQVFLVSSMRARFIHEGGARHAVTMGFVDAAKVVTAAGIIMVAVFAAFVPHGALYIKPVALGLAVGVFVDAFIVRMTLVPAVMMLLGERAWWLPRWLDRLIPVLDVEGESLHRQLVADEARAAAPARAIQTRGLGVRDSMGPVFAGVDLDVPPGALLVVHGGPGAGKTSLLLALSGRMDITEGSLDIAGYLMPDQAAAVRRVTALAEIGGVNDLDPLLTVSDHLVERLATRTWHPWVGSDPRTMAERLLGDLLGYAVAAVPGAHASPALSPSTRVRDLRPLERWTLGVTMAMLDDPRIVLVDDVDSLRGGADRAAAWAVLGHLAGSRTVVASCRDLGELPAELVAGVGGDAPGEAGGIPIVVVELASQSTSSAGKVR